MNDKLFYEVTNLVMDEIGLDVDPNTFFIINQDDMSLMRLSGKSLIYPFNLNRNNKSDKNIIDFDPIKNNKLMRGLFGHYSNRLLNDEGTFIHTVGSVQLKKGKIYLESKVETSDGVLHTIKTNAYSQESIRYIDLIFRLNHSYNEYIDQLLVAIDAELDNEKDKRRWRQ